MYLTVFNSVFSKIEENQLIDTTGTISEKLSMQSLYIDENGFLFHICTNDRFGVGLIKSPGLAEELYSRFDFVGHTVEFN